MREPTGFITPRIDGAVSTYFEWLPAGQYIVGRAGGSMHQVDSAIRAFYYGFDRDNYTVELVKIIGDRGTIVARTNITVTSKFSSSHENLVAISQNCSRYLPPGKGMYASMDVQGAMDMYGCIRDFAVAQGDLEICKGITAYINNSFIFIDWCVGDFAVNKSDLSICAKRERAVDRALCRAEILGDFQECLSFECDFFWSCDQQKEICLQNFAISHKNETLCRQVQDAEMRNRCLGLVLLDKSSCEQIRDNESRSSCLSYINNMPGRDKPV